MNNAPGDLLGGRFALRSRLGAGAFGIVYEAVDTRFGGRVAVKVLARERSQAILRFKREFRSLADVVHPNLVRLYELAAVDDTHYFTMELVDGVDFLAHVTDGATRPPVSTLELAAPVAPAAIRAKALGAYDPTKLRAAFLQLTDGVQALHDAGKLHCDIKPSNVLVSKGGRVVLLDFGLVADLEGVDERHRGGMGTPGYVAPEQARGEALTTAADWYAVGAILHEALTGELPSGAANHHDTVDGELAALARELVAVDPDARPRGSEVRERLGGVLRAESAPVIPRLFGRQRELAALRDAWGAVEEGRAELVRVVGPSGIGKTALVETFLDELPAGCLVLRGRCYEQESVPYKALDSVVDALARHLNRLGSAAAAMRPDDAGLLGRVFPVLRDTLGTSEDEEGLDSQERRRRAFFALRSILERVARERPLVCFVDDVQWGDVDSARLLAELVRAPSAPRMLFVLGHRPDESAAFLATLGATALVRDARTVTLSELDEGTASALAQHLLVGRGVANAAAIGKEASGNPFFIQQLAARVNEHGDAPGTLGLSEVILSRAESLDDAARQLAETVALAGQPIEEDVAIRAASLDAAHSLDAAFAIRHARLVTARASGVIVMLEPSHDRVRETLVASITEGAARDTHRRIAEALIALSHLDPERLVHHFRGAADDGRTREYAVLAADRADEALAFDRAASYRGLVLELTPPAAPDRWQLLEKHASSLANAGRAFEAADTYERAANALEQVEDVADRASRIHMLRRVAGGLTLRSGRLELGLQRMGRVLSDVGVKLPRTRSEAIRLAALRRIRLFMRGTKIRRTSRPDPVARRRLDAIWSASTGIIQLDQNVGYALTAQYLLEALDLGDPSFVARGLTFEQVIADTVGGRFFWKRAEKLRREMDALVEERGDPFDRAFTLSSHGGAAWFRSDWQLCFDRNNEALRLYAEHCRGVSWEIALCEAYRLPSLAYLGDMQRLRAIIPGAYAAARERGDLFSANTLRLGQQSLTFLVENRPEEAIAEADAAIAPFPQKPYIGPHYHHLFAVAQANLFRGRTEEAWEALQRSWHDIESAQLLVVQTLRVEIRHLRARAAIAHARVDRARSKELLSRAEAEVAKIAKDQVALASPFASLLRAGIASTRGLHDEAARQLRTACDGLERAKMALYLQATRDRLGRLVGGSEGARLCAEAAAWMKEQEIRNPDALVSMLIPGV